MSGYRGYRRSGGRHAEVYTDGACSNNGYSGARGGYGVHWPGQEDRDVSAPLHGRQTNNRAEIQGARHAIDQARSYGYDSVNIKTDSQFLQKGATEWGDRWRSNGWRTADGGQVKNRDDWQQLERSSRGMNVTYEYVPAHSGNRGNERADQLANQGARSNRY